MSKITFLWLIHTSRTSFSRAGDILGEGETVEYERTHRSEDPSMPNNDEPVCKKKKQTVEYKQRQLELVKVITRGRFKVRSTITS